MQRHEDVELVVQQMYSVPEAEIMELTAQLPDSFTKPVLAPSISPPRSLSSILRRNQLDIVIPSGFTFVAVEL